MTPNVFAWADSVFVFVNAFWYEYDFYDNWKHDIRLEKVLLLNSERVFSVCIGAQRAVRPRTLEELGPIGKRAIHVGGHGGMLSRGNLRLIAETVKRFPRFQGRPLHHRGSRESDGCRRSGQSS